jgi:hypothetical protein
LIVLVELPAESAWAVKNYHPLAPDEAVVTAVLLAFVLVFVGHFSAPQLLVGFR